MFRSLKEDITESQTDIRIQKSDLFEIPLSLNTLQIDNKLIIYNKMEKETDFFLLKDCKRGAFMTKASDHSSKTPLYKLSDHVYKVFTEKQKQRLKDLQFEWHLQKVDEKNYLFLVN